jgi:hypothetical protein
LEFKTKPNPGTGSSYYEKQGKEEDGRESPRFVADKCGGGRHNNRGCDPCLFREEQRGRHKVEESGCTSGAQAAGRSVPQTLKFRDENKQATGEQKIAKRLRHGVGLAYEIKKEWISQTEDPPRYFRKPTPEETFARDSR